MENFDEPKMGAVSVTLGNDLLLYSINWRDLHSFQTPSKHCEELGYKSLELAEYLYQVQGQNHRGVWILPGGERNW